VSLATSTDDALWRRHQHHTYKYTARPYFSIYSNNMNSSPVYVYRHYQKQLSSNEAAMLPCSDPRKKSFHVIGFHSTFYHPCIKLVRKKIEYLGPQKNGVDWCSRHARDF
jgi:hypothetical protein